MAQPIPHFPLFIDGQWVDTDCQLDIINPATGELAATAAKGTVEHADRAVAAALSAHRRGEWRNTAPQQRADLLSRIAEGLDDRLPALVNLHIAENGVTFRQAFAFHVGHAIAHLQYFADLARTYSFEESGPLLSFPTAAAGLVRREPIGVVAGIVPWNFPLLQAIWKLGPALAAGNCVVMKTDEKTPTTLLALAEVADEVGLPRGVLNVITGRGEEVGARLAAHPDVRKIAFTGSTAVGKSISTLAAQNVKRVTLELGGKGPNIILPDADLTRAIDGALFACCLYQGQTSESGTRLLVPERLYDDVLERLTRRAATIRIGDPTDFDTDMGPVISAEYRGRIQQDIELAVKEGARVVFGGEEPVGEVFSRGHWVLPTILADVDNAMTIAREEVFGPVLCVIRYRTVAEAIEIANDTEYGLSAGVWTEDIAAGRLVAEQLEAGTVWINDWHMVNAAYPFGGFKQSGIGRELGPHALDEYTEQKFVHINMSRRIESVVYDAVLPRGDD